MLLNLLLHCGCHSASASTAPASTTNYVAIFLTALGAIFTVVIGRWMALGLERASLNKREQAAVRQELVDVHRHLYQSSFVLDSMKDMYNSTEPEADDTKRPMGVTFTKLKLPDDTLIFTPASFRDLPEASVAAIHQLRLPRASANVPPFPLARICDPCLSY